MTDDRPKDPTAADGGPAQAESPTGLRSAAWTDAPSASGDAFPEVPATTETDRASASASAAVSGSADDSQPNNGSTGVEPGAPEFTATAPTEETPTESLDFRQRATLLADHHTWLERPSTIRGLKWGSLLLLAATVAAEAALIPDPKAHFEGIDGWVGFHAVYGFVTCVAMVLGAKFVLGSVLKRKDTYYDG